jgi:hypothetical protein
VPVVPPVLSPYPQSPYPDLIAANPAPEVRIPLPSVPVILGIAGTLAGLFVFGVFRGTRRRPARRRR